VEDPAHAEDLVPIGYLIHHESRILHEHRYGLVGRDGLVRQHEGTGRPRKAAPDGGEVTTLQ